MKTRLFIMLTAGVAVLAGCFYPLEYEYKINTKTGAYEVIYRNLVTDATADTSAAQEWQSLKNTASSLDSSLDTNVIVMKSQKLFPEDSVLSGKRQYQVRCPACFPSRKILLETITRQANQENLAWYNMNGELALFTKKDECRITRTNGKLVETAANSISLWSAADSVITFSYRIQADSKVTSLLKYYLKDRK